VKKKATLADQITKDPAARQVGRWADKRESNWGQMKCRTTVSNCYSEKKRIMNRLALEGGRPTREGIRRCLQDVTTFGRFLNRESQREQDHPVSTTGIKESRGKGDYPEKVLATKRATSMSEKASTQQHGQEASSKKSGENRKAKKNKGRVRHSPSHLEIIGDAGTMPVSQ